MYQVVTIQAEAVATKISPVAAPFLFAHLQGFLPSEPMNSSAPFPPRLASSPCAAHAPKPTPTSPEPPIFAVACAVCSTLPKPPSQSKRLNLRDKVARIEWTRTGSAL